MNLTVNFHAECLSFSEKRYLAIGGNQLTIWEEVTLNEGSARAWFNVHSAVMPRAFVEVRFSPCERLFATAESMVISDLIDNDPYISEFPIFKNLVN